MNEDTGDVRSPQDEASRSTPNAQAPRLERRSSVLLVAALVFVVLLLLAFAATRTRVLDLAVKRIDRSAGDSSQTVLFIVEPGTSASDIAERLREKGLITNPTLFLLLARYYGFSQHLQAGEYELSPGMTMTDIMGRINRGVVHTTTVTVLEGWRQEEVAQVMERNGIFPAADFRQALGDRYDFSFLPSGTSANRLEGYLFPDTYSVHPEQKPADLIREMLDNFGQRVVPLTQGRQLPGGLSLQQALVVASIVEREAARDEERPIIAAVLLNRLKIGMKLEADPTIQYAVAPAPVDGQLTVFWKNGITATDKLSQSPYNTYKFGGLPPGPICSPGLASIKAVLDPATVSYLFFVARGDGTHAFANTFDEHLANVERYQ